MTRCADCGQPVDPQMIRFEEVGQDGKGFNLKVVTKVHLCEQRKRRMLGEILLKTYLSDRR